jgi:serine/threonine-protein kinase HipA
MRRTKKSGALSLWMNGQRVGAWIVTAQGEHELHYDETWLASPLRASDFTVHAPSASHSAVQGRSRPQLL